MLRGAAGFFIIPLLGLESVPFHSCPLPKYFPRGGGVVVPPHILPGGMFSLASSRNWHYKKGDNEIYHGEKGNSDRVLKLIKYTFYDKHKNKNIACSKLKIFFLRFRFVNNWSRQRTVYGEEGGKCGHDPAIPEPRWFAEPCPKNCISDNWL